MNRALQWWAHVHAVYPSPGASLLTEGMAEYGALSLIESIKAAQAKPITCPTAWPMNSSGARPWRYSSPFSARHDDLALTFSSRG